MTGPRAVTLAAITAALLSACATHRVRLVQRTGEDLVVLLPGEDGVVGRAAVSNPSGAVELEKPRAATVVSATGPPTAPAPISNADLQQLFGDVLAALPAAPERFTLFFRFDSDELTDQSRALLPTIQKAVKGRRFPEVAVIGHTDRIGTPAGNLELGLKRAQMVRRLLIAGGLDAASVDSTSHGERDPLVPTNDEVPEARNRRVEISVR